MKHCTSCDKHKPLKQFYVDKNGHVLPWCKKCRSRRGAISAYKRRRSIIAEVNQAKDVPCTDCGVRYPPYVMDFDHISADKFAGVSWMARRGYSLRKIHEEIAKCDVVCANCHRERTHRRAA